MIKGLPFVTAVLACALGSCQSGGGFGFAQGSPAGKPIAVESIEGAPASVQTAFAGELATAASARKVELVGKDGAARYRLRGYLTAQPTADGGTALAYVLDVFDSQERRAQRVAGSASIKSGSKKNPWEGLDKEALARLAAKSMDDIATFLAEGPLAPAPAGEPMDDPSHT
ncbi:MAG TPA: hypothetical protein VE443_07600 [Beijerinckiaceae bacterium]|jgi:hypothetical protein|nr:putative lipoprotein [Microvirga sp.]HZB37849.1 hypothetical protein [Beijerinckiaceae bacterium]